MKKAVVIGGFGHIGSYLVPKLEENGYEVTVISRGNRKPYNAELPVWDKVKHISCDRTKLMEENKFGTMVAEMEPDLIFDAVSYNARMLKELCDPILANTALASKVKLIQIGSIWVYGYKITSPVTEDHPHNATCGYGTGKTEAELYLRELSRGGMLNTTVLHPGHICGDGWYPINPQGNLNPQIYKDIIQGREIILPDDGSATLHHVHADDIAGLALAVLENPDASYGQAFHATSKYALSLRGFAELLFEHFGHKPNISYMPFEQLEKQLEPSDAAVTLEHIARSPCCSMEKAEKLLGFVPKHSSIDTVISAIHYQMDRGALG